ncbi:hypothetical protein QZM70_25875 [Burkholderia orbicola]|uniref:Uncharacterized protein n=1 Tax=Burkholderia orbicola TaxID=2978683 RepID=A0ABT8NY59_9BURK|nr:hypothetical protein [Burkholderia orbicola]MDN7526373.1 hypothetical protein [Burkholderia orbicola]
MLDRALAIEHPVQQIAEVVVKARLPQSHADCFTVGLHGLRIAAERAKRKCKVCQKGSRAANAQRGAYVVHGVAVVSTQIACNTPHVQCIRMARLTREHRAEQGFGACGVAGLQMPHGGLEMRGAPAALTGGASGKSNR